MTTRGSDPTSTSVIPDSELDLLLKTSTSDSKGIGSPFPRILGISGPPGTGKSTLALRLRGRAQSVHHVETALLSLDDVYRTKAERLERARSVHPLAAHRGPPGTHDLELLLRTLDSLKSAEPASRTLLPRFDKLTDERKPRDDWPMVEGRPHLIIVDGWCLGAIPVLAPSLESPINERERREDADGRYRTIVNQALRDYEPLVARLDSRIHLETEWENVLAFREEQERSLEATTGRRFFSPGELISFLELFERVAKGPFEQEKLHWTVRLGRARERLSLERTTLTE